MNFREIERIEQASRMSFAWFDEDEAPRRIAGGGIIDYLVGQIGSVRLSSASASWTEAKDRP